MNVKLQLPRIRTIGCADVSCACNKPAIDKNLAYLQTLNNPLCAHIHTSDQCVQEALLDIFRYCGRITSTRRCDIPSCGGEFRFEHVGDDEDSDEAFAGPGTTIWLDIRRHAFEMPAEPTGADWIAATTCEGDPEPEPAETEVNDSAPAPVLI